MLKNLDETISMIPGTEGSMRRNGRFVDPHAVYICLYFCAVNAVL